MHLPIVRRGLLWSFREPAHAIPVQSHPRSDQLVKINMQTVARTASLTSVALVVVCFSGCFNYLRPDLGPPGTIGAQRSRMVLNDPYPSDYLGPSIPSGRPRGFELPLPEAQNNQYSPYSELNKANLGLFQRLRSNRQFGYGYGPNGYQGGYAPTYGGTYSPGLYTPNVNPVVINPGTINTDTINPGTISTGTLNPSVVNQGAVNQGGIAVPPGYLPPGS
ncbi:MAG: hypothetical protein AAF456_15355 [Planctomycetota bacterium]